MNKRLDRIAFRLRGRRALDGALRGLAAGLAAAVLIVGVSRLLPFPAALAVAGAAAALGLVAGTVAGYARQLTRRQAAAEADRAAGTEELLSTAAELDPAAPFAEPVIRRAEAALAARPVGDFLPARSVRWPWIPAALAALVMGLAFVPEMTWSDPLGRRKAHLSPGVLAALEKSARDVKRVAEQIQDRDLSELAREMQKLAAQVRSGDLSKKEALAKIAELTQKAEEARRAMEEKKDALKKLENSPAAKDLAEAVARGDRHEAAQKARELGEKLSSGAMTGDERKNLADTLERMGREGKGETAEAARQAAEAIAKGDSEKFGERMQKLAERMQGARAGKPGASEKGGSESAEGEEELADAQDDLADAEDDVESDGASARGKGQPQEKKDCPDCEKKKSEGREGG